MDDSSARMGQYIELELKALLRIAKAAKTPVLIHLLELAVEEAAELSSPGYQRAKRSAGK